MNKENKKGAKAKCTRIKKKNKLKIRETGIEKQEKKKEKRKEKLEEKKKSKTTKKDKKEGVLRPSS